MRTRSAFGHVYGGERDHLYGMLESQRSLFRIMHVVQGLKGVGTICVLVFSINFEFMKL